MFMRAMVGLAVLGVSMGISKAGDEDLPPPHPLPPAQPRPMGPVLVPGVPFAPGAPHAGPFTSLPRYDGPVMPPRHVPVPPGMAGLAYVPPNPPAPHNLYKVSAYAVWQNYSWSWMGYWRPRVISTNEGSWYYGNGRPYPFTEHRQGEVMPWGPGGGE